MVGKTLIAALVALVLFIGTASAMTPMPVGVQVVNEGKLSGYDFTQTNLRTGETVQLTTLSSGANLFDWSNAKFGFVVGDSIKIVLLDCADNPDCVQVVTIEPSHTNFAVGLPIKTIFDLTGTITPACEICTECQTCIECETCHECEVVTCEECEECPETTNDILSWLLGLAAVGAVGVAGYITKVKVSRKGDDDFSKALNDQLSEYSGARYFKKDGKTLVKHIHKGIIGYHSPDIVHNDPKWRHEQGRTNV